MKLVDVKILLYAVNEDLAHHQQVRKWLEDALNGTEPIGLAWTVLVGFLRISTNPKAFRNPLTPDQAASLVDAWLLHPRTRLIVENSNHWQVLRQLLSETNSTGNVTTDAHLAALAITHDATMVSCDSDFSRFKQLKWQNPTEGS